MNTVYQFQAKCIAFGLACLLHLIILILLLYITVTPRRTPPLHGFPIKPARICLAKTTVPPQQYHYQSPLMISQPPSPADNTPVLHQFMQPPASATEPTQTPASPLDQLSDTILPALSPDTYTVATQELDTPKLDTHKLDTHEPVISVNELDILESAEAPEHAQEITQPIVPDNIHILPRDNGNTQDAILNTAARSLSSTRNTGISETTPIYISSSAAERSQAAEHTQRTRHTRRKKRYVNRRLQAATQTAATSELVQAFKQALKTEKQPHLVTRAKNYTHLEQQAAQAGISVEHMAQVQDQLAHMKYAHYEHKAHQVLRETFSIHKVHVSIKKPIVQYFNIVLTINKEGTVDTITFCTELGEPELEEKITKIIKLAQFAPLPDHFGSSSTYTFPLRSFANLKEGSGYLTYGQ